MPFIQKPKEVAGQKRDFRKTEYITLVDGTTSTIRVLNDEAYMVRYHYINGATVRCLSDDVGCPVCDKNQMLISQHPDDFRSQPGWSPRRTRYYVNVLDKTVAKVCPNCSYEEKNPTAVFCSKCNTSLAAVEAAPLNSVKVLAKGPALFDQLNGLDSFVTSSDGSVVGITGFDVQLVVRGKGKETTITAIPGIPSDNGVEISDDALFNLEEAIITLSKQELVDLQSGVSLRDIFAARKLGGSADAVAPKSQDVVKDVGEDNQEKGDAFESVRRLFGG